MSNYLNPGNKNFEICAKAHIYVDKTGLIGVVNRRMIKVNNCICVTHPRRFGKTYAADMLAAYYSRGCDSRAQFENLKIARDPSFEEHLNRYDVFRINMADVINMTTGAETGLKELRADIVDDLKEAYPDITFEREKIVSMLETVHEKTGMKFVFIIDEWDCPVRERPDDVAGQKLYLQFLKDLFKDDDGYLALCYMTGILPIKKTGTQSGLNNFDEYGMTRPGPVGEFFGFTEDEVKTLCAERGRSFDGMREWYGAYDVGGVTIYNPWSVVNSLTDGEFASYWTKTESYEELMRCIKDNEYGTHEAVMRLILGETYTVNPDLFANDLVTLECLDDVLTLLVHLGYLTYDETTGRVRIPNLEIRREFIGTVERMNIDPYTAVLTDARKLFEAFRRMDGKVAEKSLDSICDKLAETLEYDNEAAVSAAVRLACLSSPDAAYTMGPEVPAGDGVADFVLTPTKGAVNLPMIIGLRYDKSADEATGQTGRKRYAEYFKGYEGDIVLIGINCDDETKRHGCRMEVVRNA